MAIQHKKNSTYYLAFPMLTAASPETFITGETVADTAYYKDGSGAWTSLAIADTVAEIGTTGMYEVNLVAAEMNHDQVIIKMTSASASDAAFVFDMRTELAEDLGNGSGKVSLLAATQSSIDVIEQDTATDIPALIAALNDISPANVLTQVNAALDAAIAELGVAAPSATPTLRTGLMLLYMSLRNKTIVQTSGVDALEIHNNAGTKIASKLITDDGSDYTEAEMA